MSGHRLTPEQRALLRQRLSARPPAPAAIEPPVRRAAGPVCLSPAEQRLLFLERLGMDRPCYNLGLLVEVAGPLDPAVLRLALDRVVQRHAALRTRFAVSPELGEPVRVVDAGARVECPLEDASGEEEARRLARDQALRPFDLAAGPVFRCRLLRLGPADHRLAVSVHHIVFDGWSAGVLLRDLAAGYGAALAGATGPAAPVAIPPEAPTGPAALASWRRLLEGWPLVLDLPTDMPRPAYPTYRGARLPVALGPEPSERVRAVARECRATPFVVLLTALGATLGRLAGADRVLVGCPVANRDGPALEDVIGFFVNTLPMPVDLRGRPGFRELVERTRALCVRAFAHRDLPLERLVEALDPPRDLSRNPVFQAAFAMQNAPPPAVSSGGLDWRLEWLDLGTSKFDLLLDLSDAGDRFVGHLEHSTDLWEPRGAARLGEELVATIEEGTR